jgi:superfamily II DNA or RNA helicase
VIGINIGSSITRIEGPDLTRVVDLYEGAPEPGSLEEGMRTTPANLIYLLDAEPGAAFFDPTGQLVAARAARLISAQDRPKPGEYERNWPFKRQPFPFQMEVFAAARVMPVFALAPVAMGCGKTKMTLDIAADKFMRDEIDGVLVIAPNGVHKQWVKQAIPEHGTAAVRWHAAVWAPTRKTPPQIMRSIGQRSLRVLTMNVESFSSESGKSFRAAREFLQSGRIMIVLDESSRVKSNRASRTKSILKLRQYSVVRCILTGTPITRGLEDLYTQYEFLDPAIIGMSSFYAARARYCVLVPAYRGAAMGAVKVAGYRNVEEFVRKIAPVTFFVGKDVLGLPEKTFEVREVTMSPEQQRLYKALAEELIEDLRASRVETPANAAVRLMRLQQVLCGYKVEVEEGVDENGDDVKITSSIAIPSRRLEALYDVLTNHDGQAVIWCKFTNDILDVSEFLREQGHEVVTYYGETPNADRAANVAAFKEGRAQYFVGNPDAAGTGIDGLQVAELAVYYSNGFRAESRWQSEDRIHRIGMRGHAHYVDLVVPDSVDELVLKNLKMKGSLAKAVFENPALLSQRGDEAAAAAEDRWGVPA